MAVKHIREYYNQVCDQYMQMQDEIKDFQQEAEKGLIEPERLEQIKKTIEPLKNNYMTLSWIMYLLNKPQRESKEKAYEMRNKKFLKTLDKRFNQEGIIAENDEVIKKINY